MPTDRITEIREREADATPGPWRVQLGKEWVLGRKFDVVDANPDEDGDVGVVAPDLLSAEIAEFIAHAREDIPWLLAELDAAKAENERLREIIRDLCEIAGEGTEDHADDMEVLIICGGSTVYEKLGKFRQTMREWEQADD